MVRTPRANLKICQHEYPEYVTNGFDGVRALSPTLEKYANIPTPPSTKERAEVPLSAEPKVREKAKMAARKVEKER